MVSGCHGLEDAHPSAGRCRCRCAYRARAWAGRGGWARSGQVDARATIGPYRQPQLLVSPRRRVGTPQPPPPCVSSCDDHIILSNPSKPCAVPVRRGDSVGRGLWGCACICRRGCEATRSPNAKGLPYPSPYDMACRRSVCDALQPACGLDCSRLLGWWVVERVPDGFPLPATARVASVHRSMRSIRHCATQLRAWWAV